MRAAWFLAISDFRHQIREKETLLWAFVMPIVFIFFIGHATGGFGGGGGSDDPKTRIAVWTDGQEGFLVERVHQRLEDNGYEIVRPATRPEFDRASRRLLFPVDFEKRALAGEDASFRLLHKEASLTGELDRLRVGRAVYTVLADLVAAEEAGVAASAAGFARLDEQPRSLTLDVQSAGKRRKIPSGFDQAVPGIIVMFTLIVLLTSGIGLVIERREGLLRRLASAPLSRGEIVLGKWLARMMMGAVQISFAMLAGTLLFGVSWGPDLPTIVLVLLAWAAVCSSGGLLVGCTVRTEGQAVALSIISANVLAALGGCWWPIEITAAWMQTLAHALPTGWVMNALHHLSTFQSGPASAVPSLVQLTLLALVLGFLAVRRFRYD